MPDFTNITTRRVEEGVLLVTASDGGQKRLPVASATVGYTLDQIPVAQIVPAVGEPITGFTSWDGIPDIGKNEAAEFYVTINGVEQLMISGFISSISTTDESSPSFRRLGASISIQGRAVKLAGAPSTSFVYSNNAESIATLSRKKLNVNVFSSQDSGTKLSILGIENFVSNFLNNNPNAGSWPAEVIRAIAVTLYEEHQSDDAATLADEIINAYAGAQMKDLNLVPEFFLRNMGEKFSSAWRSQNAWEAILGTARYFMMHVIPFNTGFYIANPYSLDRNFDIEIKAGEYLRLAKTRNERTQEPINGVIMRPPAGIPYSSIRGDTGNYLREAYAFPRPKTGNVIDGYYHFRQFPSWLYKERAWTVGKPAKGKPFGEKPDPKPQDGSLEDYYKSVGNVMARSIYGQLLMDQTQVSITFPFRTDLMPGTRFALDNSEDSEISFIGDTMHGMVTSTQFRFSAVSESPDLSVVIQAVSMRNEQDNEKDDLTYDGHPVFDDRWTGTELDGTLGEGAPDAPGTGPANAFDSGTAVPVPSIRSPFNLVTDST